MEGELSLLKTPGYVAKYGRCLSTHMFKYEYRYVMPLEEVGDRKLYFSIFLCNPRDMERTVGNMSIWLECREENNIFRT